MNGNILHPEEERDFVSPINGENKFMFFFFPRSNICTLFEENNIMARSLMLGRWRLLTEQISVNNIYLAMCFEIFETSTCWLGNPCIDVGKWEISTLDWYIKILSNISLLLQGFQYIFKYTSTSLFTGSPFLLKL